MVKECFNTKTKCATLYPEKDLKYSHWRDWKVLLW